MPILSNPRATLPTTMTVLAGFAAVAAVGEQADAGAVRISWAGGFLQRS